MGYLSHGAGWRVFELRVDELVFYMIFHLVLLLFLRFPRATGSYNRQQRRWRLGAEQARGARANNTFPPHPGVRHKLLAYSAHVCTRKFEGLGAVVFFLPLGGPKGSVVEGYISRPTRIGDLWSADDHRQSERFRANRQVNHIVPHFGWMDVSREVYATFTLT